MVIIREEALEIVKLAVEEFNNTSMDTIIRFDEGTILYGREGNLQSIDLVSLIVDIEYRIEERFGITGTLTDEKAMSEKNSPFRSIGSLIDYICNLEVGDAR